MATAHAPALPLRIARRRRVPWHNVLWYVLLVGMSVITVFPFAWIGSLFDSTIAVYAVPNSGGWYDFGFFLGVTVLGGGSHFSAKKARPTN